MNCVSIPRLWSDSLDVRRQSEGPQDVRYFPSCLVLIALFTHSRRSFVVRMSVMQVGIMFVLV